MELNQYIAIKDDNELIHVFTPRGYIGMVLREENRWILGLNLYSKNMFNSTDYQNDNIDLTLKEVTEKLVLLHEEEYKRYFESQVKNQIEEKDLFLE